MDPENILKAFDDLEPIAADCERGCTHKASEPQCALDAWVASGEAGPVGIARLESFRRLLGQDETTEAKELGSF